MKIAIASDHAGFALKEFLKANLPKINWIDEGPNTDDRVDYPDFAAKVAKKVLAAEAKFGLLVCGSGLGMGFAANRFKGIRACVVESEFTARLSRAHNDANILCLGSRVLAPDYALKIVQTWLETEFEGGRHAARIQKADRL